MRKMLSLFSGTALMTVLVTTLSISYSSQTHATAAFASATGSKCNKCHTVSFPRLTARGERFMRNGFQIRKENDGGFGLDDDEPKDDKLMRKLNEVLSVTGDYKLAHLKKGTTTAQLGTPEAVGILATAKLGEDTPIWVGIDVSANGAEVHRYTIGRVNVLDTTYMNFRAGSIDPTTWTSFYGHSAALDSAAGDIGAYGGGHHGGGANFTTIGPGYSQRNGIEYYGYSNWLLWSAGLVNGDVPDTHDATTDAHHEEGSENFDKPDYWISTRIDFLKGSSASLLWYNANGGIEKQAATGAINLRLGKLDLRSQFTLDVSRYTDNRNRPYGATLQADYEIARDLMFIYRYDTTYNGSEGGIEGQITLAAVMKPLPNVKVTASYVYEQDAAAAAHAHDATMETDDHGSESGFGNHAMLALRYMF